MQGGCSTRYSEFWLRYLRAHSKAETRALHYVGSLLVLGLLAAAIWLSDWRWLVAMPIVGYAFAWGSHCTIERNRPETFGHPLWSLFSDYRMLLLALTRRLGPHLDRAGLR
jgi:hypothetical protein